MKSRLVLAVACLLALTASSSQASTINVLWYTGGAEVSGGTTYETALSALSAQSLVASATPENTLNITFWNGTGAVPAGTYNTLVVASSEGPWSTGPSYGALQTALNNSSLTIGNRVMATGQDADWHYTHTPGPASFNGPQGFLIDAINWSGSGTGMGVVFLGGTDGIVTSALNGLGAQSSVTEDAITIPAAFASFPINAGLTSAGLSNWTNSAHDAWNSANTSLWTAINLGNGVDAITVVSAQQASGGTSTPEPASLVMLGIGGLCLAGYSRRRKAAGSPVAE
jgi:hypothetical protein